MSFRDHGAQQRDVSALNKLKLAAKITMNMLGGNSKEIFELFINKLVFYESVSQRWSWWSWLAISSLDAPLERNASLRITSFFVLDLNYLIL